MPATAPTAAPHWDYVDGAIIFLVALVLGAAAVLAGSWLIATHWGWPEGGRGLWRWVRWALMYVWDAPSEAGAWVWPLRASGFAAAALPIGPAIYAAAWVAKPGPAEIHVAGRQLSESLDEAIKEMQAEAKISGEGIRIHPSLHISRDRETRHGIIAGSVGGGKTVMLFPVINEVRRRGDRMLIHDNKGDFTSQVPGEITLFAPWDKRSYAWDIGADVLTKTDAQTVAARMIPEGSDPMWSSGSRQILTAVMAECQFQYAKKWGFAELREMASVDAEKLQKIVMRHVPEARHAVENPESKTTLSFLIQMGAYLSPICDLAEAWEGRPKFSFRRWLLDPHSPEAERKVLILQGNGRFSEMARNYMQPIISVLGSVINSPQLPDDSRRRVWLILDEFPQLGKLDNFSQFLEIGRSKGCCVWIGIQDIAQLRELYGENTVDAWSSMVGTYLIARTQGVETPEWLSRLVGERSIRRYSSSISSPTDPLGQSGQGSTRSEQWEAADLAVIRPDEITSTLGPEAGGVKALFLTGGKTVYRLRFPYPPKKNIRPSYDPAPWVLRGDGEDTTDTPAAPPAGSETAIPATAPEAPERETEHEDMLPPDLPDLGLDTPTDAGGITGGGGGGTPALEGETGENEEFSTAEEIRDEAVEQMATAAADVVGLGGVVQGLEMLALLSQSLRIATTAAKPAARRPAKPAPANQTAPQPDKSVGDWDQPF